MYCSKCGSQVKNSADFCFKCGAKLDKEEPKKITQEKQETINNSRDKNGSKQERKQAFFMQSWFIYLMLLIACLPLGILLMWLYGKQNLRLKVMITILYGIIYALVAASYIFK